MEHQEWVSIRATPYSEALVVLFPYNDLHYLEPIEVEL